MQIGVEIERSVENKRLFIVVADEIASAALQFMLADENETHELGSLEQAYEKAVEWSPHMILLGQDIVEQKGVEVLSEIKAKLPEALIVLIAESPDNPTATACLQAGASGLIPKPLSMEAVRLKVNVVLGREALPMVSLDMLK